MGYLKSIGTTIIYIGAFCALVTFIPGIPPEANFIEYKIQTPKELTGQLSVNDRLNNAEVLFKGQLRGPEGFASYNGELYTGVVGGYIMKVTKDKLVPVVKLGKKCDVWLDTYCGKPLGLKFDKKGALYVCDASNGIFKVDVKTGKYEKVVGEDTIQGKKPKIFNSLDIASNGDIYWSDSSTDVNLDNLITTMMANPSGRLFRYNAATKKNEVLIENLGLANGVALSEDEQFVVVAESLTSRITKYFLKGPKAGKSETWIEGLPGIPDNIHSDGKNGFLVGIYFYADEQNPQLFQSIIPHPFIRRMFARLVTLYKMPFRLLRQYYPEYAKQAFAYFPGATDPQVFMSPPTVKCVLRIDSNGKIIDAAYSTDDKFTEISSAHIHAGYLWIGSPHSDSIYRVPLTKAFPSLTNEEKKTSPPEKKPTVSEKKTSASEKKDTTAEKKSSPTEKKPSTPVKKATEPEKKSGKTVKKDAPKK